MSVKSPMIRLTPLHANDLPNHASFGANPSTKRPDLLEFAVALLDQGRAVTLATEFNMRFKHHSQKSSPPSNNEVELLSTQIPASDLQSLPWSSPTLLRPKPTTKLEDENWYARRSYHHNLSVKRNSPGTASWHEFVYGLRDHHSKHEFDFTPDIYDAHLVCDWNDELNAALANMTRTDTGHSSPQHKYSHATMSIYEMCHKLPGMVGPRCFPVLVCTASVSDDEFLAVTLPVDISHLPSAFYSNGRNKKEGHDSQMKKSVTIGHYCAVERLHRYSKVLEHVNTHKSEKGADAKADAAEAGVSEPHKETRKEKIMNAPHVPSRSDTEGGEEIEWIMATASDARGALPMTLQRMGTPGAVAKDVGLFLKWIHKVGSEEVKAQSVGVSAARPKQ